MVIYLRQLNSPGDNIMFNKLAYSAVALTVSLGTVMSCQAEATGKDYASAFNQVKQINAGDLNVGYVDIGPKEGQPVILLHGWPYDIHSYAEVAPALAAKGYRVIVPSLRGYCTTRFISEKTCGDGKRPRQPDGRPEYQTGGVCRL